MKVDIFFANLRKGRLSITPIMCGYELSGKADIGCYRQQWDIEEIKPDGNQTRPNRILAQAHDSLFLLDFWLLDDLVKEEETWRKEGVLRTFSNFFSFL